MNLRDLSFEIDDTNLPLCFQNHMLLINFFLTHLTAIILNFKELVNLFIIILNFPITYSFRLIHNSINFH